MNPRPPLYGSLACALWLSFSVLSPNAAADPSDGAWHEHDLLQVSGALPAYDAAHDELLSVGGNRAENWTLPLAGIPAWQPLPLPSSSSYLDGFLATRDPATGLVYYFDSALHSLDPRTGAVNIMAPGGTDLYGFRGALVFDPADQRIIAVADGGGGYAWAWALDFTPTPTWSPLSPSGTQPRTGPPNQAVLDPVRHRVLIPNLYVPEIVVLNLDGSSEWLTFATNAPPVMPNPNMLACDPASDRIWTIDGQGEPYSLSLTTYQWEHVVATGPGPSPRQRAAVTIDALRHRLLVNGGQTPSGDDTHNDVWALSLDGAPAWTELVHDATRPPVRGGAGDGYDAAHHRMMVFGGSSETGGFRNDTWVLDLTSTPVWSPVAPQGPLPAGRYWHASAWDDAHDQLVVYGGFNGDSNAPLADLWTLSFSGGIPTWSEITPPGPAPGGRMLTPMVYDSGRDRFLLMLGYNGAQDLQDVWELRLSPAPAWRKLSPAGTPPSARSGHMCVYDPVGDRVLLFAGGDYLNDLWALDLANGDGTWQPLSVPPGPSGRNLGVMRIDALRHRLVLFGGFGVTHQEPGFTYISWLNDSWALNLDGPPSWHALAAAGILPRARDRANGAYDPIFDRLVLACGGNEVQNDLWTLDFGDVPTPTLIALATSDVTVDRVRLVWSGAVPGARATAYRRAAGAEWGALATLTADGEGFVTLEDRDVQPGATLDYRLGVLNDRGEEFFGATTVQIPVRALSLVAKAADGRASFAVELPSNEPATLALFDVAGRRIWSRALGDLGPGVHEVGTGDAHLAPALYFARLSQGAASRFARFAIVR